MTLQGSVHRHNLPAKGTSKRGPDPPSFGSPGTLRSLIQMLIRSFSHPFRLGSRKHYVTGITICIVGGMESGFAGDRTTS